MTTGIKKIIKTIINWLLPQSAEADTVDGFTPDEMRRSCQLATTQPHPLIYPLFDYRDLYIKKAVHLLKYKGKARTVKLLGSLMTDHLLEIIETQKIDRVLVVPIPLSVEKHAKRGFNQSELLCREMEKRLSTLTEISFSYQVLVKTTDTPDQTSLNRSQRKNNLKKVFKVAKPEKIKGETVIVIDDVSTTGTTLARCLTELKQAGAKRVLGLVVAH